MKGHAHLHFFCGETTLEHDLEGVDVDGSLKSQPDPLWRALWLDGNWGRGRGGGWEGGGEEDEWGRGKGEQARGQDVGAVGIAGFKQEKKNLLALQERET